MCSLQNLSASMSYSWGIFVGSDLANLEVLHVSHAAVDHFLRLLAEWIDERAILVLGLLATLLYIGCVWN